MHWAAITPSKTKQKQKKCMEIGSHRGMIANEHMKIGSNSYVKVKSFKYLARLFSDKSKFYSGGNKIT